MEEFKKELYEKYKGELKKDYDIKGLTTWKIGGVCRFVAFPESEEELVSLCQLAEKHELKHYIVGKASNILFGDKYFPGMVIYLGKNFNGYSIKKKDEKVEVSALSGLTLNRLGKIAAENSLEGLEYLSYIPGTLGGALITNAEAHKISVGELVKEVKVLEKGKIKILDRDSCNFTYRSSVFENSGYIIIEVVLELRYGNVEDIEKKMAEAKRFRMDKQPKKSSAGSVFKNPEIGPAGLLIDKLGLKGKKIGEAVISDIHANFILNEDKAKSNDVLKLIEFIQKEVKFNYNIDLELEIKIFNN